MSKQPVVSTSALRGSLKADGLGARGIERAARNQQCQRLGALTVASLDSRTAARDVYKLTDSKDGQSPFAIIAGNKFENDLFDNDCQQFISLYQAQNRLPLRAIRVVDVSKTVEDPNKRRSYTLDLLRKSLQNSCELPDIIIKPRLSITILDQVHEIEPDAFVRCNNETFYRVVEIKSYLDRGGKTSLSDVRHATRQAAVGVVALREALAYLGEFHSDEIAPAHIDLIFAVSSSEKARLSSMPIEAEVASIEKMLSNAPSVHSTIKELLGDQSTLDSPDVLDLLPTHYRSSCREHCALSTHCRRQANQCADHSILGDQVAEQLRPAKSLLRVVELMKGQTTDVSPEEQALARNLQRGLAVLRKAVNDVE